MNSTASPPQTPRPRLPETAAAPLDLLARFGPAEDRADDAGAWLGVGGASAMGEAEAMAYCRRLALGHYENFSVLSRLVPADRIDDFAAVYAFCRTADDLGDETGRGEAARARSVRLLGWWRGELHKCFAGAPVEHPVFIALAAMRRRREERGLVVPGVAPFEHLIEAFEQDQVWGVVGEGMGGGVNGGVGKPYETWEDLLAYCRKSADPVGRIVLALGGGGGGDGRGGGGGGGGGYRAPEEDPASAELYRLSDCTCTALQLVNFWQDVRRDLLERDRVYVPLESGLTPEMLRAWVDRPEDCEARVRYILALRPLVEKTAALFAEGRGLPGRLEPRLGKIVRLFGLGGETILRAVERGGCTTLWRRPRLGKLTKAALVARAMLGR